MTATTIDVAVTLVNLAGAAGNGAVGVPSPQEQQRDWQQIADSINASGGAACRKLVLHYYSVNPLDSSSTQQQCINIAGDRPFLAMDSGALSNSGAGDCLTVQKVPLITQYATSDQVKKYYPYYLSPVELSSDFYRTGYYGAQQKGYFGAGSGFKKLGILYQSCRPGLVEAGRAALRKAGIPDSAVVTYDLGCPAARQNSPTDYQQAALTFKQANPPVTHVTQLDASGWAGFTKAAAQQNYKPKYVLAEDASASDTNGAFAPDPNNLDGAVNIVGFRYGEAKTPGYRPTTGTASCNAIYAKHGQKSVYEQGAGYGGVVCNYLWFLKALLDKAPRLDGSALVNGVHGIGKMDLSYPFGPVDFGAAPAGSTYPKDQWRVDRFSSTCACWQVLDPTYHAPPT